MPTPQKAVPLLVPASVAGTPAKCSDTHARLFSDTESDMAGQEHQSGTVSQATNLLDQTITFRQPMTLFGSSHWCRSVTDREAQNDGLWLLCGKNFAALEHKRRALYYAHGLMCLQAFTSVGPALQQIPGQLAQLTKVFQVQSTASAPAPAASAAMAPMAGMPAQAAP